MPGALRRGASRDPGIHRAAGTMDGQIAPKHLGHDGWWEPIAENPSLYLTGVSAPSPAKWAARLSTTRSPMALRVWTVALPTWGSRTT